jgi:hypothetical protein
VKKAVVYIYNSFSDPLFQSNMYLYLLDASRELDYQFVLITYEQKEFTLPKHEVIRIQKELIKLNIKWTPLKWHSGRFKLIKKAWDVLCGFTLVINYRIRGYQRIVSLGTVSGSFAFIYAKILRMRHYLYQYEPHSEFLKDMGILSKKSTSFRLLNWLEWMSGLNTEVIATGTTHMMERLENMGTRAKIFRIPSCVDDNRFHFSEEYRDNIRRELKIVDRKVLIYVGKFGGIYFDQEVFDLCKNLLEKDSGFYFLFLSPNNHNEIRDKFQRAGIKKNDYHLSQVPYSEVYKYVSASDIGLVSVPPLPSQKFRSPIKVGEYLCCGIPYIVCKGVSEDDKYALENNVGVVLDNFDRKSIDEHFIEIKNLLNEDKRTLRSKCRKTGLEYRSYSSLKKISLKAFDAL